MTLLSHYYRPDDPVELTAAIGQDWADVLEHLPCEHIQAACLRYMRDNPRRKPTPGDIVDLANKSIDWDRRRALPPPEPVKAMPREKAEALASKGREINPQRKAEAEKILSEVLGRRPVSIGGLEG